MEEENPAIVEDVQVEGENEIPNKKIRHRKKELYKSIKKQMEFYFSDANLTKDRFLGKLIAEDEHVDISIFIRFNKIRALTTNVKDIADALRNSELLSVTEDSAKVFRTTPLQQKYNTDDCTIYVEQLPPDAQHDWLKGIFSAYGKVAYVSIPKYRTSGKIKGFAFVEFDTAEEANKTLEAFSARGCRLSSQIAPEKLCSISTYEPDEGKSENLPTETDKEDISEKINEEEDGQFQDKLSKKNKKRKKSKQEHGEEMSIEESEVIETEGNKEGDMSVKKLKRKKTENTEIEAEAETGLAQVEDENTPPKKKKRKKTEDTEIEAEAETGLAQVEDENNTPPKKKKRKKSEGSTVEETEEKDTTDVDTYSVHQPDDIEERLEKKKRKRKSEDVEDKNVLELGQDAECETKEVVKRKKTKSAEWDEKLVDETGAEVEIAEDGAEIVVKKKNRKRKKKHKKDKQDVESSRLQILSKREWKRLRNKYLNLQKMKMKCLKQYLGRNPWNNRHYDRFQHGNGQNQEKEDHGDGNSEIVASVKGESEKKPKFTFTPGVIVHAMLDEPVTELRKFKVDAKALSDVEYVDVIMGANEAFLRCATPTAAEQLVTKAPWQRVEILKGDEESQYWNKMTRDREQKFSNNIRVKQRGRDKILRRAERELGKHIKFDE